MRVGWVAVLLACLAAHAAAGETSCAADDASCAALEKLAMMPSLYTDVDEDPLPAALLGRLADLGVIEAGTVALPRQAVLMNSLLEKAVAAGATNQKAADVLRRNVRLGKAMAAKYIGTWSLVLQKKLRKETAKAAAALEDEDEEEWPPDEEDQKQYNEDGQETEVIWEGSGKEMREKMARKRGESPLRDEIVEHLNQTVIDKTKYNWTLLHQMVLAYKENLEREYEVRARQRRPAASGQRPAPAAPRTP